MRNKPLDSLINIAQTVNEKYYVNLESYNKPFYFIHLYFKVLDESAVDYNTFGVYEFAGTASGGYLSDNSLGSANKISKEVRFIGFPPAPESTGDVTFTVKTGGESGTAISGAELSFTGTSTAGTDISTWLQSAPTTNTDGRVTVSLPVGGNYKFQVKDVNVGGTNYTMDANAKANGGVTFAVTKEGPNTASYTAMEVVTKTYNVPLQVYNADGNLVDLADAEVSLDGTKGTIGETGKATVSLTATGQKALKVSVPGYQKVVEGANIQLGTSGEDLTLAITSGQMTTKNARITVEGEAPNQYVKIVLKKTVTSVEIPIPVPQTGGENITEDQANKLVVTLKPKDGSAQSLVNELGGGPLTLKAPENVAVATDAAGKVTGITVTALLPDGSYEMTVGGSGLDPAYSAVTVLNDSTNTTVNVGGTAALTGGAVTGVTGGVTASQASAPGPDGNYAMSLKDATAATLKESADVTVADGSVTVENGTPVEGGLLNSETVKNELTPTVITDPVYHVDIAYNNNDTANPKAEITVSLKNAKAVYGTFGLYYDPKIFAGMSGKTAADVVNVTNENIELQDDGPKPQVVYPADANEAGYVTLGWKSKSSTGNAVDATLAPVELFKITLPVSTAAEIINNIDKLFTASTVTVMEYDKTQDGAAIAAAAAADGSPEAYNSLMSGIWRSTDMAGLENSVHLEEGKAIRGGFYQITQDAHFDAQGNPVESTTSPGYTTTTAASHDVRMEFTLPDFVTRHSADFRVKSKAGEAIKDAVIKLYSKKDNPDFAAKYDSADLTQVTEYAELITNSTGNATAAVDPDDYYYVVAHPNYWAYPDGTVGTTEDGLHYDTFTVAEDGTLAMLENTLANGDKFTTQIKSDYISPVMDAMSYHKVVLEPETDKELHATISGLEKAFNQRDYTFTITPNAGYTWNITSYADMDAVAAALKEAAKRYGVKAGDTDVEATMFRDGAGSTLEITWDAAQSKFVIAANGITGDAVGEVTFAGGKPEWYDLLRAGDIVLEMKDDMLTYADLTLTVTAGVGGKVSAAEPTQVRPTDAGQSSTYTKDGTPADSLPVENAAAIRETLKGGRTDSAVYTFTPEAGKKIDKVIVNGVSLSLAEAQKTEPYSYQFVGVSGDESIVVTFVDGESPLSDPVVNVVVGANGSVDASYTAPDGTDPTTDTLAAGKSGTYILKADTDFTATVKPATGTPGYQIDKIVITKQKAGADEATSEEFTLPDSADTNKDTFFNENYALIVAKADLQKGDMVTVAVTFKEAKENAPSTQVIVTSQVAAGLGVIAPSGVSIHAVGDTPSYTMKPSENWLMKNEENAESVVVKVGAAEVDKSEAVTVKDDGSYQFTMDPLTADAMLNAKFTEKTYRVTGNVGTVYASKNVKVPADLIFVRAPQPGKTDETKLELTTKGEVDSSGLMAFDLQLPAGTWTLTVKKQGYLDRIITDFTVTDKDIVFGASESAPTAAKTIALIPGDAAGEGFSVNAGDVGQVAAGWVKDAVENNRVKGDVNESTIGSSRVSDSDDMTLVIQNYLKLRTKENYAAFCAEDVTK